MIVCSMLATEYERETHIENEERSLEILSNFHRVKESSELCKRRVHT